MNRLFGLLASASEKRPWLVVLAVVAVTVFMSVGAARMTTEISQEAMMPEGYDSITAFEEIGDQFGGSSFESALVTAPSVTSSRVASRILAVSPESLERAGVEKGAVIRVETYLDGLKKMLEMQGQPVPSGMMLGAAINLYLSSDYAKEQVLGKTITEDGTAALLSLQLNPDLSQNDLVRLADSLDEALGGEFSEVGARVFLSGDASMERDTQRMMNRETSILMLVAILFVMFILYLTFRRVSDIFFPLLVIIVAIQWLMGFMGWAGIPYTTMSVAIMPLMLGINIAYVIHILSRYYEERESGSGVFASATDSIKTVGVAVFLTALTTVIGFASFTITDLPQLRDFGVVCMVGIVFSFLLSLTFLPAIVVLRDRRKKSEKLDSHLEKMRKRRRDARYGIMIDRGLVGAATSAYHHHWWVLGGLAALLVVAVIAGVNVKTGADIRKMFPSDMPSMEAGEMITEKFGAQSFDMLLVRGDVLDPVNLETMLEMEDAIASDPRNAEVDRGSFDRQAIMSVADMVAQAGGGAIPASREAVEAVLGQLGTQMDTGGLVTADGKYALVMVGAEFSDTEDEARIKSNIMKDAAAAASRGDLEVTATGMSVLISDLMGKMLPTQLETSALALLLCLLVLIIVFKSFFYGLATLSVVIVGLIVQMIMLYVLGWPLDFMTVTISALVIGAGVDYGIHITHRFREQLHGRSMSLEESIRTTVLHVGRSLVAAAFTTAGVFAIRGISTIVPRRRFGGTVAVGLLAALVGAVVVLPSLLAIVSKRRHEVGDNTRGSVEPDTA